MVTGTTPLSQDDLHSVHVIIAKLLKRFKPANDDKLRALIRLLKQEKELKGQKVRVLSASLHEMR